MEQWGDELHLGRSRGEVVLEDDLTFVEPALPGSSLLPRDPEPGHSSTVSQFPPERGDALLTPTA